MKFHIAFNLNNYCRSCSIAGKPFASVTKLLEEKTFDLMHLSMKRAGEEAKENIRKSYEFGNTENVIEIPTSFDGTWKNKGWSSHKGNVSS